MCEFVRLTTMLPKCVFVLFAVSCSISTEVNPDLNIYIEVPKPRTILDPSDWWKTTVFYQIYPRSFKDSNADGIGDLNGIISKLDHFKELGVTGIWLSPIYESGGVDQGYDISNYEKIDPEYGTMADFEKLVGEAHSRDIKVILDYVPNHSSNQHKWFKGSENKTEGYDDYYVWRDQKPNETDRKPPNNWLSVFHGSAWEWSNKRNQYYLHQFAIEQPDLNYKNLRVRLAMTDVLKFWLDKGIDGFRMDAVPYLFEDDEWRDEPLSDDLNAKPSEYEHLKHIYTMDQDKTYDLIYELRKYIDQYNKNHPHAPPKILMSEGYTSVANTMRYYGDHGKQGAHIPFNFLLIPLDKNSGAIKIVKSVNEWLLNMPDGRVPNWVVGNHDNHRVATRFGPKLVDNVNILIAFLSGVMVTYNGEEIGQENGKVTKAQCKDIRGCKASEEGFYKESRDFERTPFQWDDTKYAGFTDPGANGTWLPVSAKYTETNLKKQKDDPSSHFEIYKCILKLRKEKVFTDGKIKVEALSDSIIKVTRGFKTSSEFGNYIVLINIDRNRQQIKASQNEKQLYQVVYSTDESIKENQKIWAKDVTIAAFKSIIFKVISKETSYDWWKHAVIYQIYVRSFKDSDNDGNGDLKGIVDKLNYLKKLGVDAIALSPIYKSPQVHLGYDISDFTEVDEIFGTMNDFYRLVVLADVLKIKIIMDFVPNHSSNKHEWFIKSENGEIGYEDYYVWKDGKGGGPPNNWLSTSKGSAWTWSPKRKQYYLHQFDYRQPDLNYENPAVKSAMKEVLKFWLEKGVTGFRMNAVPYLMEDNRFLDEPRSGNTEAKEDDWKYLKHIYTSDLQGTFDIIYDWRDFLDNYTVEQGGDERILITEANTDISTTMYYYGNRVRRGAHFTINYRLIEGVDGTSDATEFAAKIKRWIDLIPKNCISNWMLGNNDKHRLATRFGQEKHQGLIMLESILPGVMVTYNGEEIGLENGEVSWQQGQDSIACNGPSKDFRKVSRDFQRTPFHWDNSTNAGFNAGEKPWLPVSKNHKKTNLLFQINETKSHYELYKRLMKLREVPAFVSGTLKVKALTDNILASSRFHRNGTYIHLFNLGKDEDSFSVDTAFNATINSALKVTETNDHKRLPKGTLLNAYWMTLQGHQSVIAEFTIKVRSSSVTITATSRFIFLLSLLIRTIDFNF